MPLIRQSPLQLYYDDTGQGEPLILLHGFTVNREYWHQSGLTERLATRYRVITPDLRGHGDTRQTGYRHYYDVDTLAGDIGLLARHLKLQRFHLVGHSAGGMVAIRYAIEHSERLKSLTLIGTSAATIIGNAELGGYDQARNQLADFYAGFDWSQIFNYLHHFPGPLLFRLDQMPNNALLWGKMERISRLNNPATLADFARGFFTDPNPRLARLRQTRCPTLVMYGEYDKLFVQSCEQLAREIPDTRRVIQPGIGHMNALEDPEGSASAILAFLDSVGAKPATPR